MKKTLLLTLLTLLAAAAAPARAQEDGHEHDAPAAQEAAPPAPFTGSLLFTPAEIAVIQRALSGQVAGTKVLDAAPRHIPQKRVIAVSGVVFRGEGDWIVWLNGQKVTPGNLLPEIMDIRVENERVHLKWFDIGMNKVISISLRPHQTYDIVTGVLLPG